MYQTRAVMGWSHKKGGGDVWNANRRYSDDITHIIINASATLSGKRTYTWHSECPKLWWKVVVLQVVRTAGSWGLPSASTDFPADQQRRAMWVAAVKREGWEPTEHSWLCSAHFVSGSKNNDPLSPDYVPSIFSHVRSPRKRKAEQDLRSYTRRKEARRKRSEAVSRETACQVLLSFTSEEANEPADIETVESKIAETGTMTRL